MHSTFSTLPHFRKFLISLALFSSSVALPIAPLEQTQKDLQESCSKITARLVLKIATKERDVRKSADIVRKDPLYHELELALTALEKEPIYRSYQLLQRSCRFIQRLQTHNHLLLDTELLTELNKLVDELKNEELFTSFRATLKKERVALIEIGEEKDLMSSLEKILTYQGRDLQHLAIKEKDRVEALASYQHAIAVQKKYLASQTVKNFIASANKLHDLLAQYQITLLKNKEYQQQLRAYERRFIPLKAGAHEQEIDETKNMLSSLERDLHTIPLEDHL